MVNGCFWAVPSIWEHPVEAKMASTGAMIIGRKQLLLLVSDLIAWFIFDVIDLRTTKSVVCRSAAIRRKIGKKLAR